MEKIKKIRTQSHFIGRVIDLHGDMYRVEVVRARPFGEQGVEPGDIALCTEARDFGGGNDLSPGDFCFASPNSVVLSYKAGPEEDICDLDILANLQGQPKTEVFKGNKTPNQIAPQSIKSFQDWKDCSQAKATGKIFAKSTGRIYGQVDALPYFEPKAVYMFGINPHSPGTNMRFIIKNIMIGGMSQLASIGSGQFDGLLSDVFNRSDEPMPVKWGTFSAMGLGRDLEIEIENPNCTECMVFACIWGIPKENL